MRAAFIHVFLFSVLAVTLGVGCASAPTSNRPEVALQLQKSLLLSACRYTEILKAMDRGDVKAAKDDIDWWIDQAIIELLWLEERYPHGDWDNVQQQDAPFSAKRFYREIAQFRRDHPRRHSVPLDAKTLGQIEKFVEKYQ
jgi:hypothetical protein